jgi:hypothetical protein
VLVWYMRDGDEILVPTQVVAQKIKNIQRTGWASLSISQGRRYLTVRGHPTIETDHAQVHEHYRRIVERYLPTDEAAQWIANAEADTQRMHNRVIIRIPAERILGPERSS